MASVAHIVAIPWLWSHKWLYISGGLATRWTAVLAQGGWAVAVPSCRVQGASKFSHVPISRSLVELAMQLNKTQTLLSGDPQNGSHGLHGVIQRHLSSVSTVLCSAQGQEDWLPLAFGNSGNVWGWGPTSLKCVPVWGTQSPVNVTALLKDLSWNTGAPGRSWWCWKPGWSLAHTSSSFSSLASKVSLLFLLKVWHYYECQHRFLLVST